MRFLADESCDFTVVTALRAAGHDVSAIAEINPGAKDPAVLALARSEQRVLLTEDKDFGLLAYAGGKMSLVLRRHVRIRIRVRSGAGLPWLGG